MASLLFPQTNKDQQHRRASVFKVCLFVLILSCIRQQTNVHSPSLHVKPNATLAAAGRPVRGRICCCESPVAIAPCDVPLMPRTTRMMPPGASPRHRDVCSRPRLPAAQAALSPQEGGQGLHDQLRVVLLWRTENKLSSCVILCGGEGCKVSAARFGWCLVKAAWLVAGGRY